MGQWRPRGNLGATYGRPGGNIGAAQGVAQGRPCRESLRSALQGQSKGGPGATLESPKGGPGAA